MTYEQVIERLIELDIAKWGEAERAASNRMNRKNYPTIGLALNWLAHYDIDNIDEAMAAEAQSVMTDSDRRVLRCGG